jgi:cytochrome c556
MKIKMLALLAGVLALAGCGEQPGSRAAGEAQKTALAPPAGDARTIRDLMDSMFDPSGDFLFESVQDISDAKGVRRKEPRTDAEWAAVRQHLQVLIDAPDLLVMEGRKAARPEERSANPAVENEPEEVERLIAAERPEFVRRARALQDAARVGMKAADARDVPGLSSALLGIDKACESCHLHFWYPNDHRAQLAAKEEGVLP